MTLVSLPHTLTPGTPENVNHVQANDVALRDGINGQLDHTNLTASHAALLGVSQSGFVRRGKSIIATNQGTTSTTYTTLTTPDRVSGIVMPTDGLLVITYQAVWNCTVANKGLAAVFIGGNQLQITGNATTTIVQEITIPTVVGTADTRLYSTTGGLSSDSHTGGTAAEITTGLVLGGSFGGFGPIFVERLAAGTYDVEVRFKVTPTTDRTVSVKNRALKVLSMAL